MVCDSFRLLGQDPVIATETIWPAKPEIVTVQPFTEKACCSVGYNNGAGDLRAITGLTWKARRGEGGTYMRLKRPSRSGRDAKEKAGGRARVGSGGWLPSS